MNKKELLKWINEEISYNKKWDSKSKWMEGYCKGQITVLKRLKEVYYK